MREKNHLELDGKTQDDDLLEEGRGCEGLYVFTLQISIFNLFLVTLGLHCCMSKYSIIQKNSWSLVTKQTRVECTLF